MKQFYFFKNEYGAKIKLDDGTLRAVKDDTMKIDVDGSILTMESIKLALHLRINNASDETYFNDVKHAGTSLELQDKLMEYFFGHTNSGSGGSGGSKETISFEGDNVLDIPWTAERLAAHGINPMFYVEIWSLEDNKYHPQLVDVVPDDINNPTSYHLDFGADVVGRVTFI